MISKKKGVYGGRACVDGTRVPVHYIAAYWNQNFSMDRILELHPELKESDVSDCLKYYEAHKNEIIRDMRENEE